MCAIWSRCAIAICDPCVSHMASILQEHMYTICESYGLDVLLPSVIHVFAIWHQYCKAIMYTICKPYSLDLQSPSVIHVSAIWHQYYKTICEPYGLGMLFPSVIHVLAIWHQYCKNIRTSYANHMV